MKRKLSILFAMLLIVPLSAVLAADEHSGHDMHKSPMAMEEGHDNHQGHEGMDISGGEMTGHVHKEPSAQELAKIGVIEHLGEQVALDAQFMTADAKRLTLREIVDKPTIFAPVYYSCPNVCNFLQSRLAEIIPEIKLKAGQDFQVVSVSFDENDNPQTAARKKKDYMKAADGKIPADSWLFLSGDRDNILKFTESVGFRYLRRGKDFAHPVAVMAVSPSGKIVRYLYGTEILPFELTMAAVEASKEQTGLSVKKLVSYCFSYDPQGKKYVFNIMRVSGIAVLTVLAAFAAFLFLGGKKRK